MSGTDEIIKELQGVIEDLNKQLIEEVDNAKEIQAVNKMWWNENKKLRERLALYEGPQPE